MSYPRMRATLLALLLLLLVAGSLAVRARAEELSDDGGAEWRLEQPQPPAPPAGVEASSTPIGLGKVGDIEFYAPNRGALITAGNGSTVSAGVWTYNGEGWHELATVCGATDGRIAWAGPDEFWTVSDGRPGQAKSGLGTLPPLEDNTLCRFALAPGGEFEVVASYASLAFQSTSYLPMHAAGCLAVADCWFSGEPLQAPQVGSFQLHWNGTSLLAEPYLPEGHAVQDMRSFEGQLYESLRLSESDRVIEQSLKPPAVLVAGEGPAGFEAAPGVPLYGPGEFPYALDYLHLGADEDALWGAAGPAAQKPELSQPAGVTVVRYSKREYLAGAHEYVELGTPSWSQVIGPETTPSGAESFAEDVVQAIAAEPGTDSAWLGLDSAVDSQEPSPTAAALLARVSADGTISDRLSLPSGAGYGPKGATARVVCPADHDCWMVTDQGWLFHLSTAVELAHPEPNGDPAFSGQYLITERPADQGVPQEPSDALPVDDSGLEESGPPAAAASKPPPADPFATVTVPLLSNLRSKLIHGTTLELSFHLSVKARVRLLAKRRRSVVASTPTLTLKAGNRSLRLRLSTRRWPTKLDLQTHALAPLKTTSTRESSSSTNVVGTSLAFPTHQLAPGSFGSGLLP